MSKMNERDAERWERTREKGMWRHVARKAAVFGLAGVLVFGGYFLVFGRQLPDDITFYFIYPFLCIFSAILDWSFTEAKYKTFILDKKLASGLQGAPQPNK